MSLSALRQLESPEATAAFAQGLAHILRGGDVVSLAGDLGAGKTTLVRELALAMGVPSESVHSPTFVMVNQYALPPGSQIARHAARHAARLVHIDAYRLHGSDELDTLGWDTFIDLRATDAQGRPLAAQSDAIVLIEWAQRIESALPQTLAHITLTPTSEDSREVSLDFPDSWHPRPGVTHVLERDPTRCRITKKWVAPTSPTYPFFDDRSRLADLGKWFGEGFAVSREIEPDDLDDSRE